jgi:outer membrane immunogenic protein
MKKLLLSAASLALLTSAAVAADLPSRKAEPLMPPPPPPPMWTGFYAGLNAGGTWANSNSINLGTANLYQPAGSADYAAAAIQTGTVQSSQGAAFIGGGQLGYNWQTTLGGLGFVFGAEADMQGTAGSGAGGSQSSFNPQAGVSGGATPEELVPLSLTSNMQGSAQLNWLGTVRGRIGYLIMPSLLLYGTGGLAYGGYTSSAQTTLFWKQQGGNDDFVQFGGATQNNTTAGWTAGGGAEWMFMPNVSAKVEYLYYDLGTTNGSFINPFYGINATSGRNGIQSLTSYSKHISGNIVRAGVNYHFNWGATPVVAKY